MKKSYMPFIIVAIAMAVLAGISYKKHMLEDRRGDIFAAAQKRMPQLNVLFVGNSHTYVNDMPYIMAKISASYSSHPVYIHIGIFAHGGYTLKQMWSLPGRQRMLNIRKWDFVVLQERSANPLYDEGTKEMLESMRLWNEAVRNVGAKPIIYETYARKPRSFWYTKKSDKWFYRCHYGYRC